MGRLLGDILLECAQAYGLPSRPADEGQTLSWVMDGYRAFNADKKWWWLKTNYETTVADDATTVPLPPNFRELAHPKRMMIDNRFYYPIPASEVDRYTLSGNYPVVLPAIGRPASFYLDEANGNFVFPSAPGSKLEVVVDYYRRVGVVHKGMAQAGAATTITLDTLASDQVDYYKNLKIRLTSGVGGGAADGQVRTITGYTGGTSKIVTVSPAWTVTPNSTTLFQIGDVLAVDNDETSIPEDYSEALVQYFMYRRWTFLTDTALANEHLLAFNRIVNAAAKENRRRLYGQGDHALAFDERPR